MNFPFSVFLVFLLLVFFLVSFQLKKKKKKKKGSRIFFLLFGVALFFQQGCMLQWVKNSKGRLVRISIPQGAYFESSLNLDQMEPP